MPEKRIPISRKQHDAVNDLTTNIRTLTDRLSLVASTLMAGIDEEIPTASVTGAVCVDGAYSLVLDVPDASPDAPPAAEG